MSIRPFLSCCNLVIEKVDKIFRSLAMVLALTLGADALGDVTLVIDVRTPEEWGRGHLLSARRVDWQDIGNVIGTLASSVDHSIVLYCRSGSRSGKAKDILDGMVYTNVINAGSLADVQNLIQENIVQ